MQIEQSSPEPKAQTIQEIFGPPRRVGDVGIEIEVEGVNIPKEEVGVWKPIPDGSLRGEAMEYVTRNPVKIETVRDHVKALADAFVANNGQAHEAHRGSIHIHHNVQKLTTDQVFGVIFTWTMVEPLWMRMCGPTREANLFCFPGSYTGDIANWCRDFFKCVREASYHRFPPRGKYAALNTDPIAKYGSIEFRTFASSIDPDVVTEYANWCHNLVEYGAKIDLNSLSKEWQKVQENPEAFVKAIFGEDAFLEDEEKPLLEVGLEAVSDLVLVYANHKTLTKSVASLNQAAQYFNKAFAPAPRRAPRVRWAVDEAGNGRFDIPLPNPDDF